MYDNLDGTFSLFRENLNNRCLSYNNSESKINKINTYSSTEKLFVSKVLPDTWPVLQPVYIHTQQDS